MDMFEKELVHDLRKIKRKPNDKTRESKIQSLQLNYYTNSAMMIGRIQQKTHMFVWLTKMDSVELAKTA